MAKPALDSVESDEIRFYPSKFKNLYRHWMENIKDWCISRQLWWGHQIPVYYLPDNTFVVAETEEKALKLAREQSGNLHLQMKDLRQEEDVLDTWASSWLWPISVFDGVNHPDNKEIQYYYPTQLLATGHDIIFFWVARMIMAGYQLRDKYPFKDVYFTGMVRDKKGRKMSKQLGNSPDPIKLMEKYGADGVRVGMLLCSPAGGDLLFDESLPEQGRNFSSKIWNSLRLIKGWEIDAVIPQPEHSRLAIEWFRIKLDEVILTIDDHFSKYRLSDALMMVYTTIRDEFSGWLLEIIKPAYQHPIDKKTYDEAVDLFDQVLRLLHPFMPFISEEIWQLLKERKSGESIMLQAWPKSTVHNTEITSTFEMVKEAIAGIRAIRKDKDIANKEQLALCVMPGEKGYIPEFNPVLVKMGNLSDLRIVEQEVSGAVSFRVQTSAFFIPLGKAVNMEEEVAKIKEELIYTEGFLESVMKKMGNERFVKNAPAQVVELERKKQADAQEKIRLLKERLESLKVN